MKEADDILLRRWLEVNEHVATNDEIHAREWRILDYVVRCEDDHLTDIRDDLVPADPAEEVAREPRARDVRYRLVSVRRARGGLDRASMHVGGEDLHGPVAVFRRQLREEDRERIGLFTRRTPCNPDAERPFCQELGKHLVLEELERFLVPEKPTDPDQEISVENIELVAATPQPNDIVVDIVDPRELEAAFDPARGRTSRRRRRALFWACHRTEHFRRPGRSRARPFRERREFLVTRRFHHRRGRLPPLVDHSPARASKRRRR